MDIVFKPVSVPFTVGDVVFVNQPHGDRMPGKDGPRHPYFQAEIVRIFLDGRLEEISVITEPTDTYLLEISTVVYELKPVNNYADLVKMPLIVQLPIKEPKFFKSEDELKEYLHSRTIVEEIAVPKPVVNSQSRTNTDE